MKCRHCETELTHEFVDLINSPPSNSFLTREQLDEPETYFPLKIFVCDNCRLVQIAEYKKSTEIFDSKYVYFSSYSRSWLEHCRDYAENMIQRFGFDNNSLVVEIASNDGYLLQFFHAKRIPVLGIEPTANTAQVAIGKGINTVVRFFGQSLAEELKAKGTQASLLAGNNVLAHVPDINDFVRGMKTLLKSDGVITMEFPHLLSLVEQSQFDTIYHEHFSYLSFYTVTKIFGAAGLEIFDVDEIRTHGGSLRIYAKHAGDRSRDVSTRVRALCEKEQSAGINTRTYYDGFSKKVEAVKIRLLEFLLDCKKRGKTVAAYGAAAKGNTLLNFCGIKNDLIQFVVDASPHKQGLYLPGSHIPVVGEDKIRETKPDFMLLLPWNLEKEITAQLSYVRDWDGQFVVPIPSTRVF